MYIFFLKIKKTAFDIYHCWFPDIFEVILWLPRFLAGRILLTNPQPAYSALLCYHLTMTAPGNVSQPGTTMNMWDRYPYKVR